MKDRIQTGSLSDKDVKTLLSILDAFVTIRALLEKRKLGLLLWLRRIFGLKTEKESQKSNSSLTSKEKEPDHGRKGRKGRYDYPGAEKTNISHESLKPGDSCPECQQGKLREVEPAVDYNWQGHAPLDLHIYLLQRLLCHICKTSFTAKSPVAETAKTVDDSADTVKVSRCNRNAMANAMVACLRFLFGVPHNRLAKIQAHMGVGVPVATQYLMIEQVASAGDAIYDHLIFLAGQGSSYHADDTGMKILDWFQGKGPPTKNKKKLRKKALTSVIISEYGEGKKIVLYLTGAKQAGENMAQVLSQREDGLEVPRYMCDGLAANTPGEKYIIILLNCLDHGRRKFVEIESSFPKQSKYVIDQLKLVYKADKEAKEENMSPNDRLEYHQKHSQQVMDGLGQWMQDQVESDKTEENSPLGGAINYCLKRWTELTEFLRIPGVPLSNSEAERAIKKIITHRKNSLFYKTEKGAKNGDVIQSLVATCEESGKNPIKYLAWIQENKSKVTQHPEQFLPWNFDPQ